MISINHHNCFLMNELRFHNSTALMLVTAMLLDTDIHGLCFHRRNDIAMIHELSGGVEHVLLESTM
jgi:hypothetical protein